jgi:hypothetical protein
VPPLLATGGVPEYPEPNQEEETEHHEDYAEIKEKDESAFGIQLFMSLPNLSAPPEVGDSLVFGQPFVYFAYHNERKCVGKDCEGSHNQSNNDDWQRDESRQLHGRLNKYPR